MQQRTGFLQQCEGKIGVPTTFVEFVEQHHGHTVESRVGLQPSQKQAIGDHLHLRLCRALLLAADREADPLTDAFPKGLRQAGSSGSGSQASGFDHPDPPLPDAVVAHRAQGAQQSQRHAGRLASSWRSLEQHCGSRLQRFAEPRQQRIDRVGRQAGAQ